MTTEEAKNSNGLYLEFRDKSLLKQLRVVSKAKNIPMKDIIEEYISAYVADNMPNLADILKDENKK